MREEGAGSEEGKATRSWVEESNEREGKEILWSILGGETEGDGRGGREGEAREGEGQEGGE